MLAGLQAVAGVIKNEPRDSFSANSKSSELKKRSLFELSKPPQREASGEMFGYFYKDSFGIIHDPTGRALFTASERIDVGRDGTIFDRGEPLGSIKMRISALETAEEHILKRIDAFEFESSALNAYAFYNTLTAHYLFTGELY